jgi:outer membrane protein
VKVVCITHILFILLITLSVSYAQTPAHPDSALVNILNEIKGTPLGLQQAVDYALKNTTSIRKAEAAYLGSGGSLRRENGMFDPELFFNLNYVNQKQPTASFFSGAPVLSNQQTTSQAGLRMSLPIGTEFQLTLNAVSLSTNSSLAFLNPEYDAFGSISVRQPLLRGFTSSGRKRLTQAEQQLDAIKARYDQEAINVKATVERMYWDLYASVRNYAVQQLTRDRAKEFLKETELRARTGLVGPSHVANSKTFLAEQELLLLERGAQFERQSDQLSSLIGVRPQSEVQRFLPTDEPPENFPSTRVEVLVDHVLQQNLDILAARKDLESAQTLAKAAGWEALPRVDLIGSIGGNGLAGTGKEVIILNDTLPVPSTRNFSDALTQVAKRDFPNWSLGVEISVPLGFRSGLGEKDRLEALVLDAEQNFLEKTRALEEQVRSTYRELWDGKNRLEFAGENVEAAQEQVRIGLIEYRNGRSTAFELVRLGEDLAIAQQRYSNALIRTAKAAATMKQLTSGWYPEHY